MTDSITLAGYAPRYFSGEFTQLMNSVGPEKVKVTVEKINVGTPPQYRGLCKISAPWPADFHPCQEGAFESLSK